MDIVRDDTGTAPDHHFDILSGFLPIYSRCIGGVFLGIFMV